MTENKVARRDDALVFRRAFWLGMVSFTALFAPVAATVGGTAPPTTARIAWKEASAGTPFFGIRDQTEVSDADHLLHNSNETRGALTLRSHFTFRFLSELNGPSLNDPLIARAIHSISAELSTVRAITPLINEAVVFRARDLGIAPMQIALAEENAFIGPEGAVPEPATWFPATLVAGAIAWSQRRRFTGTSARPKRPGSRP